MVIQLPPPNNSRPHTLVVTYEDNKAAVSFLSSDEKITGYKLESYKGEAA